MMPSCTFRIADDNVLTHSADKRHRQEVEEAMRRLEDDVKHSAVVLVFLTIEYIGSNQCLRELRTAYRERKPLLILREADPNFGAAAPRLQP